jgi:hypothetical protein
MITITLSGGQNTGLKDGVSDTGTLCGANLGGCSGLSDE